MGAQTIGRRLGVVTTALTAFPADGFTARWNRVDGEGSEQVDLRWENEGWTITSEVGGPNISYVLRLSATWAVRQFLLFRDLDDPDLWLGTDGSGRWGEINGAHRPDLDGCHDIDLPITPFTHTLPIRRLALDVGDAADLRWRCLTWRRSGSCPSGSDTTGLVCIVSRAPTLIPGLRLSSISTRTVSSRTTPSSSPGRNGQTCKFARNARRSSRSSGLVRPSSIDAVRKPSGLPVSWRLTSDTTA